MKNHENAIDQLSTSFNEAPVMLIVYGPELNTLRTNDTFQEITGWAIESLKDADLITACYPDPEIRAEVLEFMHQDKPGWKKFQLTCKDGNVIDALWCVIAPGSVHISLGIDLTNEKTARKALAETEARYKAIFQATGTATLIVNEDTTIAMANQEARNVTGYPPEQLEGHSWTEFVADESLELMRKYHQLRRKDPANAPKKYEVRLINKEGDHRFALLDIVMIPGTAQSVVSILDITDLKNSEELYQSLFNNIPLGVFRSSLDGRMISANPAMAEIYGCSTVEALLERPAQAYYKEAGVREQILDILGKEGHINRFETLECKQDGTEILVSTNYTAARNTRGDLLYIDGVVEDITERRRSEDTIKASEAKFRNLAENIPGVIYLCRNDARYTMIYISTNVEKLTGYSSREFIEDKISFADLYHPDDKTEICRHIDESLAQHRPFHLVYRTRHRSGEWRWIEENGIAVFEKDTLQYLEGYLQDITDRKKTESELKYRLQLEEIISRISKMFLNVDAAEFDWAAEKTLQMIGELTGVDRSYVFMFSEDGEFVTNTNEWCAEGIEPQKSNLQNISVSFTPWWIAKIQKFENIHIPKVEELPAEAAAEKKKLGDQGIKSLVAVPIVYGESPAGFIGLDSVKKEMPWEQEDIALLRTIGDIFANTLEHLKENQERINIQNQLLQSQKIEAVGTLSGGIAHDFNNLLTIIQGHAQLAMIDMDEGNPHYRDLKQIINASSRAADLTRQLLLFSRKQDMKFLPINLNHTVENLLKMTKRLIGENIEIRTELDSELWTVLADEGNIEQVIMNLAVNARDAMPSGGKITIKTENIQLIESEIISIPESRSGRFVRLNMEDSGCGIPPGVIPNIFDPFFSTKEAGKGTGLGLSVVYGIVKKHEGWINIYSEVGCGSIFKVYLPATSQKESERTEKTISINSLSGKGERILLIEDEDGVRRFTSSALRKNGYQPIEASNAKNAVAVYEAEKGNFDLILSDVVLPDMNGYQLAESLIEKGADIPVILCSGYTEEKIIREIRDSSRFHFIQKPFTLRGILKLVHECLHQETT